MNFHIIGATVCCLALFFASSPMFAQDLDSDGIPDAFEDRLLQQFAPVIKIDQTNGTPSEFRAIPVSASWFVQHTDLGYSTNDPAGPDFVPIFPNPTPESLLIYSVTNRQITFAEWVLHFRNADWKWGDSPIESTSWPHAIEQRRGIYGRVWRPWANSTPTRPAYPNLYSVQYFMLLTWNEPGCDPFSNGYRHDGDVLCFDFCVDVTASGGPTIIHAIYYNHSRELFMTREALSFENGHPLVFLERGTNEPWPNSGGDGSGGRPETDGFAFGHQRCEWDESCCVRQHRGEGNVYVTAGIPNIGEAPWPEEVSAEDVEHRAYLPLGSLDNQLFLQYPGPWGRRGPVDGLPPRGPAYQSKMWRREVEGPWAAFGSFGTNDPFRPNLESMPLFTTFKERVVTTNATNLVFYDFLPVCDVRAGSTNEQRGLPSKPYVTVTRGAQKVASYGVLRVASGTYAETLEISKPMQIESAGGLVTIGQ